MHTTAGKELWALSCVYDHYHIVVFSSLKGDCKICTLCKRIAYFEFYIWGMSLGYFCMQTWQPLALRRWLPNKQNCNSLPYGYHSWNSTACTWPMKVKELHMLFLVDFRVKSVCSQHRFWLHAGWTRSEFELICFGKRWTDLSVREYCSRRGCAAFVLNEKHFSTNL